MSELPDFLLARIAEDEAHVGYLTKDPSEPALGRGEWPDGSDLISISAYRLTMECAAKRRIVERFAWIDDKDRQEPEDCGGYDTLCDLAAPYAEHPDYREEWR